MNVSTAIRLESVKEYYFSKKLREVAGLIQAGKPVLNMGIGSPDLPPHPSVVEALQGAMARPGPICIKAIRVSQNYAKPLLFFTIGIIRFHSIRLQKYFH